MMRRAQFHAVAAVLYLMMKLHAIEDKENDTDTYILKLKENAKRVRSEVIKELTEGIKEEFKNQFKEHELLKKEVAVERAHQRVIEEKVDVSQTLSLPLLRRRLEQNQFVGLCATGFVNLKTTVENDFLVEKNKEYLCAAGFVEFEGHCYRLELGEVRWNPARNRCRIVGADLVSINTEAENDFLVEKIKEYYPPDEKSAAHFWTGMLYEDGKYMWADGTEVGFTDWRSANEPNCMHSMNCKAFISTFRSAYKCEDALSLYRFHYICEKNAA